MKKINHNNWIKGESYQKKVLIENLKDKINLIEEAIIVPQGEVPLHRHEQTDEIFYIVENSAMMTVGNQEFEVSPGEIIHVEKNEQHGFKNNSDQEFKLLVLKINFKTGDSYLK